MKFKDCNDYKKCDDGLYRCVYVIICTSQNHKDDFYIGKHKCKYILNRYTGSGKLIKQYIKDHPNEYIKLILGTYLTDEEQIQAELYYINKYFNDPHCLNIIKLSAINVQSEEARNKKSVFMKLWHSTHEHPMKGKTPYNKGKKRLYHRSEEAINKSTDAIRGCKWMTDNISEYFLNKEYWGEFIDIGFRFGRKKMK